MEAMKVAAISWAVRTIRTEQDFFDHLRSLIERAGDADLIVLPELPVLELLSLHPDATGREVPRALEQYAARYEAELAVLEDEVGAQIVGGSHIRDNRNVCRFSGTDIDKRVLTQWEAVEWGLDAGRPGSMHRGAVGVTICYDCEFPASGRALAEAGVRVQCIPSYTETRRGFQRVRWCAQARAIENQVFVVHASLVGSLGREPVPSTYGSSAILTPSVEPFPESAVLAETPFGEESVALAKLDIDELLLARQTGDVRNWEDRDKGVWGGNA